MDAWRMLAYGTGTDSWDEYLQMSESPCLEMARFATTVAMVFGSGCLREPVVEDTARLMAVSKASGWPSMLGSLDCMH